MRTKQPAVGMLASVIAATLFASSQLAAQKHDPYHSTLYFGTGLINTPVAWVSPNSLDAWISAAGKHLPFYAEGQDAGFATAINTNIAMDVHFAGRVSAGVSAYSQNPEYGFFGQVLALRDGEFSPFLPSVAFGVRNIGKYSHEDRFMVGHDITLTDSAGYVETVSGYYQPFKTNVTLFGVATKEFSFGTAGATGAPSMSVSVGYGNGLFSDDGEHGDNYNKSGTIVKGMFLGSRFSMHPSLNTTLQFMVENDAWDYNAGVIYDWRGLSAGLYLTEIEEGTRQKGTTNIYNFMKTNFTLGYSGNIIDISRGVILRTRITELTREMNRLRLEITQRERRIAGLEVTLRRAQAGELADISKRRSDLESEVQAERDAIRAAQQRLEQLERGQQRPPATPPATPPASAPETQNFLTSPLTASY